MERRSNFQQFIIHIQDIYFVPYFFLDRLWAEIFEVRVEGDEVCWAKVSDDVVPVNITCIQDVPETVFQITAYNRHVEKIFDVKLIQPGIKICLSTSSLIPKLF